MKGVTLKKAGYYKLEVWGAQGGVYTGGSTNQQVAYGGYSYGVYSAANDSVIYVVVGQSGSETNVSGRCSDLNISYPYNGGSINCDPSVTKSMAVYGGTGGGATHIATRTGLLKDLSSYQSSVLIVAGAGGGSAGGLVARGGSGGGIAGGNGVCSSYDSTYCKSNSTGGTQTGGGNASGTSCSDCSADNGIFGKGGDGQSHGSNGAGGGGGGWYGGGGGSNRGSGGGGSGYIGNSLLLSAKGVTKQMYMYNQGCSSSTNAATKTTCTSSIGAHVANAANTGNGYARITYLGT